MPMQNDNVPCEPSLACRPPRKWLQDTGARYDMLGKNNLVDDPETWSSVRPTKKKMNLLTGNGVTQVKDEIQVESRALGEQLSPLLMELAPAALGTG